jgi:hypothetical protein
MIAPIEYGGFTIFNLEIGLTLSDKVRLKDVRHIYSHNIHNNKLTPKSQTQLVRVEFNLDLPGIKIYHLEANAPEKY